MLIDNQKTTASKLENLPYYPTPPLLYLYSDKLCYIL